MGRVSPPRVKVSEWRFEGRVQTISYHSTGKSQGVYHRVYDKGVESGKAPAGTLLRFERQMRWAKPEQPTLVQLLQRDPEELWLGQSGRWAPEAEKLVVGGPGAAQARLLHAVDANEITALEAERLMGWLAIAEIRGEGWWRDEGRSHIAHRRRKELNALGITPSPPWEDGTEVALGPPIRAIREAWRDSRLGAKPRGAEQRSRRKRGDQAVKATKASRVR